MKNSQAAGLTDTLLFRKGGATPTIARRRPARSNPDGSARVSVKLDRTRLQHLKLAAAKLSISNQDLLASALDHYLRSVVPAQIADSCRCLKTPANAESA
jgi:hypothetical protein